MLGQTIQCVSCLRWLADNNFPDDRDRDVCYMCSCEGRIWADHLGEAIAVIRLEGVFEELRKLCHNRFGSAETLAESAAWARMAAELADLREKAKERGI